MNLTEAIAKATPHVDRAMALDPTLAEAHAATGFVFVEQRNPEKALTHFRQAIQINPNYSIVYTWMGALGDQLGRYAESFAATETALRLDPLSIPGRVDYVVQLIVRNRLDEAALAMEKLASIAPVKYAHLRGGLTSLGGKWANVILGYLDGLRIDPEIAGSRLVMHYYFAAIGLEKEALAIRDTPLLTTLWFLGKPEDAVTIVEARLVDDPQSLTASALGIALAGAGDYARARPILEKKWQQSGGRVTLTGLFRTHDAAALIAIRRDAGEEGGIDELVAAMRDNVRRLHEAGIITWLLSDANYEEGLADFLIGEREKGLALIAKGAEDGYFIMPRLAYLQTLYDDPGFAPIRASQEARQKRERDRFLDIVCTNNPYAAVWQPAEGTCEKFAATVGN